MRMPQRNDSLRDLWTSVRALAWMLLLAPAGSPPALASGSSVLPLSIELSVNTTTAGNQVAADVAMNSRGDFVVVWEDASDPNDFQIRGRRYDASGTPLGPDFVVNSTGGGSETNPRVAMDVAGNFVVVWRDGRGAGVGDGLDGSGHGVIARRFDPTATPLGAEFVVNTNHTAGDQAAGAIAMAPDGEFVIVWEDLSGFGGFGRDLFARRYHPSGEPLGAPFPVNDLVADQQAEPSVAITDCGDVAIVWPDSTANDIHVRLFDCVNAPRGPSFVVNTTRDFDQQHPVVAADGGSSFIVVWHDCCDGPSKKVRGQRLDLFGTFLGSEFEVSPSDTGGVATHSSVAMNRSGRFVVAWRDSDGPEGSGPGLLLRSYDATGDSLGGPLVLTAGNQTDPRIALLGQGKGVVVWTGPGAAGTDVFARRLVERETCGSGAVNAGAGAVADVLRIDGSTGGTCRELVVGVGVDFSVALSASPQGPGANAAYAVWVWPGLPANPHEVVLGGSSTGCTVNPTPLHPLSSPVAIRCLDGGVPPVLCAGLVALPGAPARAPWAVTRRGGFGRPITLTLQGMLQDAGASNAAGFSVTNAVSLRVQ
jgi:hypothetical protein